jgi:hypothetical protein
MKTNPRHAIRVSLLISIVALLTVVSTRLRADTDVCSGQMITLPFTDVLAGNVFFCSIAEAFFTGLANGTDATHYGPGNNVTRDQVAAFVTRTLDQSLRRGSRRAALGQWWISQVPRFSETVGISPSFATSDGTQVYVSNSGSNFVSVHEANTGRFVSQLLGIPSPHGLVIFNSSYYVASFQAPGMIYTGLVQGGSLAAMNTSTALGDFPDRVTTDGRNLWTANLGAGVGTGSVSKIDLKTGPPTFTSVTYTTGFSRPESILFDGSNLWITDYGDSSLKRVSTVNGSVLQTIPLSGTVGYMVFDGTNLWIPCQSPDQIYVVRAAGGLQGTILAQLTGNGLSGPIQAAFDGERILVTDYSSTTGTVSFWKATDLSPIGTTDIGGPGFFPNGACSDGICFFVTLSGAVIGGNGAIAKF